MANQKTTYENFIGSPPRPETSARELIYSGIFAAVLSGAKLALRVIPNVEVVTLLILLYASFANGRAVFLSVTAFCVIETAMYGFGTWVPLYLIYWNSLGFAGRLFLNKLSVGNDSRAKKNKTADNDINLRDDCAETVKIAGTVFSRKIKKITAAFFGKGVFRAVIIAAAFTAFFGVLSSGIDVLFLAGGVPARQLGRIFAIIYVRGLWFYAVHFVSNILIVGLCYGRLRSLLKNLLAGRF
ncbi:MAG: hypothetical protein LBC13_03470 [Clostridiales bacterium]|nr:hypothetical protein [Clostridiales bacterium]